MILSFLVQSPSKGIGSSFSGNCNWRTILISSRSREISWAWSLSLKSLYFSKTKENIYFIWKRTYFSCLSQMISFRILTSLSSMLSATNFEKAGARRSVGKYLHRSSSNSNVSFNPAGFKNLLVWNLPELDSGVLR